MTIIAIIFIVPTIVFLSMAVLAEDDEEHPW